MNNSVYDYAFASKSDDHCEMLNSSLRLEILKTHDSRLKITYARDDWCET